MTKKNPHHFLKDLVMGHNVKHMVASFLVETTYLDGLAAKSGCPTNIVHFTTSTIPCHWLTCSLTWSITISLT